MACPPLRGAEGRGHPQGPASASTTHFLSVFFLFLLQALQKWQLSFSVSLYLWVRIVSPVHMHAAIFGVV